MSYILEALKKSDQKRKLGNVPDIHADHSDETGGKKVQSRQFKFFIFLAGLIGVNLVIWLMWWSPWQESDVTEKAEVTPEKVMESPLVKENVEQGIPSEKMLVQEPIDPPVVEKPVAITTAPSVVEDKMAKVGESIPNPVVSVAQPQGPAPPVLEEEASNIEPVSEPPVLEQLPEPEPEPEIKVILQRDLPNRVQERLPEMSISLHFYSNKPSARLVRINDKHLGEGEYVSDDIHLVEITNDGVILEYDGYRFLMEK